MESAETIFLAKTQLISNEMISLLNDQIFYIPNWKWLALIGLLFLATVLRYLFFAVIIYVKKLKLPIYKLSFYKHLSTHTIEKPLASVITLFIVLMGLNAISPGEKLSFSLTVFLKILIIYHLVALAYHAANALGETFEEFSSKAESTIDDQLSQIIKKTLRVFVVIVGVLIGLQNLGVNVTALLAGLGIGGVAIAFAAQDTVANVFGTITILFDSPFKIGDRIIVSGFDGIVEEVGFRSTRIRTLTNTLVTIPNSVIAKENIENISAKTFFRIRHVLGIEYSTPYDKIQNFCEQIRYLLNQNPNIDKTRIAVFFNGYGDSSLNVLVNCHLLVPDVNLELLEQEKILMEIYTIAAQLGVQFAFPSRTLYIQNQQTVKPFGMTTN